MKVQYHASLHRFRSNVFVQTRDSIKALDIQLGASYVLYSILRSSFIEDIIVHYELTSVISIS